MPKATNTHRLPGPCRALTVNYPLMIVGAGDRDVLIYDLYNQVGEAVSLLLVCVIMGIWFKFSIYFQFIFGSSSYRAPSMNFFARN